MPAVEILARDWVVKIGGIAIGGLQSITISTDAKRADITTREDVGRECHLVSRRAKTIVLKGLLQEDPTAHGTRDPGQEAVETAAELIGTGSNSVAFTISAPDGSGWYSFSASVQMGDMLGAEDEAAEWAATLYISGAIVIA